MGKYLLLLLFSLNTAFAQGIDGRFKETKESIWVDSVKRTFIVHERLPSIGKRSLVFLLHGNGGTGALMKTVTGFNGIADNTIVVYPDGYDQAWNDGRSTVRVKNIDDVKFFKIMTENLIKKYDINPAKVYAAGLSNGAMMALRLSCETDIFKGIAAVSASMPQDMTARCSSTPVSRLIMMGNKDPIIPFAGGEIKSFGKRGQGGQVLGLQASMEYFKKLNTITDTPIVQTERGIVRTLYNHQTIHLQGYEIDGGGHTWGSSLSRLPETVVGGLPPIYVNASEIVWSFFKAIP